MLVRDGRRDEAVAAVLRASSPSFYPELARAAYWEDVGDELAQSGAPDLARWCHGHAHTGYAEHASYATSGAEGLGRMVDVDRVAAKLRS